MASNVPENRADESTCQAQASTAGDQAAATSSFTEIWPAVQAHWTAQNLAYRTLLAVSGGADSVALVRIAHVLVRQGQVPADRFSIAHVHHGLRGSAADRDAQFVADLARELGFEYSVSQIPAHQLPGGATGDSRRGQGLEAWLRQRRYQLLIQRATECGARFIATAHHRDDHVETVLLRILRGTGIRGLAGIPPLRMLTPNLSLIRPLRDLRRQQIEAFLAARNSDYCRDASNDNPDFARNRVRQWLPELRQQFGWPVEDALANLALQASDLLELLTRQTAALQTRTTRLADRITIDPQATQEVSTSELVHFLQSLWLEQSWPQQQMNYATWRQLAEWLRTPTARRCPMLPGEISAEFRDGQITL